MKKYLLICSVISVSLAMSFICASCGDEDTVLPITNGADIVQVKEAVTGNPTDISYLWATVSGQVNLSEDTQYQVWIEYCLNNDFAFEDRKLAYIKDAESSFSIELDGLLEGTTYYYRTYVQTSGRKYYGDIKTFTTKELELQKTGAVDLGLSVKWAANNIGASTPEGYGSYIEWGATSENNTLSYCTCYDDVLKLYSYTNIGKQISGTTYDAARAQWGGQWRLPTVTELKELNEKCRNVWYTYNGVNGRLFVGSNDNCIFLPAAGEIGTNGEIGGIGENGRYQSGNISETLESSFGTMFISKSFVSVGNNGSRKCRYTIRPVSD